MTDGQIREKLTDRNLAEVARRIGVTRSWLSYFMSGKAVGKDTREKLEEYLEVK